MTLREKVGIRIHRLGVKGMYLGIWVAGWKLEVGPVEKQVEGTDYVGQVGYTAKRKAKA